MANFPTLSRDVEWEITEDIEDSTIESSFESGYVHSRPRFTTDRMKWGKVIYKGLNASDKALLVAFRTTVRGRSLSFNWTNPDNNVTYVVRFNPSPTITYTITGNYYQAEMGFVQV